MYSHTNVLRTFILKFSGYGVLFSCSLTPSVTSNNFQNIYINSVFRIPYISFIWITKGVIPKITKKTSTLFLTILCSYPVSS